MNKEKEIISHLKKHGECTYEEISEHITGDFRGFMHLLANRGRIKIIKKKGKSAKFSAHP